jgi:hypothetical protein
MERKGAARDNARMFGFIRRPPILVGGLAAALGVRVTDLVSDGRYGMGSILVTDLSAAVNGVSADYEWDPYHERPVASAEALAQRHLSRYTVRFAAGRLACETALRDVHGPPIPVAGRRRYGPFFVGGDGEPFILEWFATIPDWAMPPADAAARIRTVEQLAARVTCASSDLELAAALADIPADAGITGSPTGLRFQPPMPAADLARALGFPTAVGQTIDVHMSSWTLVTVVGNRTARPHLGGWRVDARLDGQASGGDVPGAHAPAALVAFLGARDVVSSVGFANP